MSGACIHHKYSIQYFGDGRLFAWHLYLESKCIYSAHPTPYIRSLGEPSPYCTAGKDIDALWELFRGAISEIKRGTKSTIFELGIAYTALRDIAMSASWTLMEKPCFSRKAPYEIPNPLPIPKKDYEAAMYARYSSTRGLDREIATERVSKSFMGAAVIDWVQQIRKSV